MLCIHSSNFFFTHIYSGIMAHPILLPASFPVAEYIAEFKPSGTVALRTYRSEGWEIHEYNLSQGPLRMAVNAGSLMLQPPGVFHTPETIIIDLNDPAAEVSMLRHLAGGDLNIIGADDLSYECVGGSQPNAELHRFELSLCPIELYLETNGGARKLHVTFDNPPGSTAPGYTRLAAIPH